MRLRRASHRPLAFLFPSFRKEGLGEVSSPRRRHFNGVLAATAILLLASSLSYSNAAGANVTLQNIESNGITVDGTERHCLIYQPNRFQKTKASLPLVIFLRPGGPADQVGFSHAWKKLADHYNFVLAVPDPEPASAWNFGFLPPHYKVDPRINDSFLVTQIVSALEEAGIVNIYRIYIVGYGDGGMMAYKLAAQLSDRVAAIGVVGATSGTKEAHGLKPFNPISVIAINGIHDKDVPYKNGWNVSPPEDAAGWAAADNCKPEPTITRLKSPTATVTSYMGGNAGSDVTLYSFDGGHEYPSWATETIWKFLSKHSLPKE